MLSTLRAGAHRSQSVDDLSCCREAIFLGFRENPGAVDGDDEDAAAAAGQFRGETELVFDCSRQTGGLRKVVSNAAIFDSDLHGLRDSFVGDWSRQRMRTRMAVTLSSPPTYQLTHWSIWDGLRPDCPGRQFGKGFAVMEGGKPTPLSADELEAQ